MDWSVWGSTDKYDSTVKRINQKLQRRLEWKYMVDLVNGGVDWTAILAYQFNAHDCLNCVWFCYRLKKDLKKWRVVLACCKILDENQPRDGHIYFFSSFWEHASKQSEVNKFAIWRPRYFLLHQPWLWHKWSSDIVLRSFCFTQVIKWHRLVIIWLTLYVTKGNTREKMRLIHNNDNDDQNKNNNFTSVQIYCSITVVKVNVSAQKLFPTSQCFLSTDEGKQGLTQQHIRQMCKCYDITKMKLDIKCFYIISLHWITD